MPLLNTFKGGKMTDTIKVTFRREVPKQVIVDTLITACEGGSNYWCKSVTPFIKSGDAYESMLQGFDLVDSESGKKYKVYSTAIIRALHLMAEKFPKLFDDVLNENGDADDGDIFLQLCVFEDVIYG